jgi:hypothetical protein
VADDDGALRWWDPATDTQLGRSVGGSAPVRTLAAVTMPTEPWPLTDEWLRSTCDGRTVVAAGDAHGTVQIWDAPGRTAVSQLCQRPGSPVVAMSAAVAAVPARRSNGPYLVVLYGGLTADTWWVDMPEATVRTFVAETKLETVGHRDLAGAAASPDPFFWRRFTVLADRDGTLSRWQPYNTRLDHLPADPTHGPLVGVVVLTGPGNTPVVVTADRTRLRVWYPERGAVGTVSLDVRPRCLLAAGDTVVVGHDTGLIALTIAGMP